MSLPHCGGLVFTASQTLICTKKGGTPTAADTLQGQQGATATAPVGNSVSSLLLHLSPLSPEAGSFFNLESARDGSWLLCRQQLLLTGLTVTREAISRSDCRPHPSPGRGCQPPRPPQAAGSGQPGVLGTSGAFWRTARGLCPQSPGCLPAAPSYQSPAGQAASAVGSCEEAWRLGVRSQGVSWLGSS